jgi:hypothetical protein
MMDISDNTKNKAPNLSTDTYDEINLRDLILVIWRYLRTVIVTAAVYWGFGWELALFPLTFQHRAGVNPYTSACALAGACVFGKQSFGPLLCNPLELQLIIFTLTGHPFSRSYGVNLPSSLTRVLSRALGFSPRLPVSVFGTGTGKPH